MMIDAKYSQLKQSQQSRTVSVRFKTGATRPGSVHVRAFTLIELMISIALVVVLILGVSQVFQYTTQAVGAGQAITEAIRNSRSAQTAFDSDFNGMVGFGPGISDSASLIISSRAAYAYRDAKDEASQGKIDSAAPSTLPNTAFCDLNGDGISGDSKINGEIVYPDTYNFRNHRLDTLSFFSRNQFSRQTGNPGAYVATQSSPEAWIWYGHLWLPDNGGNYPITAAGTLPVTFPCAGTKSTNPNNHYGSQLVLGRQAILMQAPDSSGNVADQLGVPQWFVRVTPPLLTAYDPTVNNPPLSHLDPVVTSSPPTNDAGPYYLDASRLDLMNASISGYNTLFNAWLNYTISTGPPYAYPHQISAWADYMMDGSPNDVTATLASRFRCNPYVAKPIIAKNMAQASPYFMGGCSQFIVEYAGDFLTQDNNAQDIDRVQFPAPNPHPRYGDVLGGPIDRSVNLKNTNCKEDGQLDFFINSQGIKQTIWYGMPRNTSGLTTTCAFNPSSMSNDALAPKNVYQGDVVPLRDWLQYVYNTSSNQLINAGTPFVAPNGPTETNAPFEITGPSVAQASDYHSLMDLATAQRGYTCQWASNDFHPRIMLIRITMTLEDPTGRLPEGQTFQYVFPVTASPSTN